MRKKEILAFARYLRRNQTPSEARFWEKVRNHGILGLKCKRQYIVRHHRFNQTDHFYIADFAFPSQKVIIEIDGEIHHYQHEADSSREEVLKDLGFRVIRFTNVQVLNDWEEVERKLKDILQG